jgi:hypothetical protein
MRVMYRNHETPDSFFYTGANYSELWYFARGYVFTMNDVTYLRVAHGLTQELKPGMYVVRHADGVYRTYSKIEFIRFLFRWHKGRWPFNILFL